MLGVTLTTALMQGSVVQSEVSDTNVAMGLAGGVMAMGCLNFLFFTIAAILFSVWLFAVADNTNKWAQLRWPPGMLVGFWYIPCANLVFPYLGLRDLEKHNVQSGERAGPQIGIWYAAYIGQTLVYLASQVYQLSILVGGGLEHTDTRNLVVTAITMIAFAFSAGCFAWMIHYLEGLHQARLAATVNPQVFE